MPENFTDLLSGAVLGGGWGATRALRPNPALQGVGSSRLKVNQFLNLSGKSGRVAGNALGVLGLFFSGSESGLGYLSDGVIPDWANTLGAGFPPPPPLHA
jgi:import inner membrane translocase subunit TIM23